ncbi:flavin reductase (DIM6/NTAB) family NADH-FMN oxidoreductase RutF [Kitasatospora sp. MAA4]|uniref:flavin reductase family protein n=1 Tax=Kitasatospora sp. MAA4 TaxID=3035093 RepID=UPI002473FFFE|nr:flavin reductase family protein [Kitasatospora sp. MAA4]MDH6131833.1 flavin reductase (DIM6/NTAB) family NADH-FMN oxidoreductase RutF [Kitasatospora sp. MAA4]
MNATSPPQLRLVGQVAGASPRLTIRRFLTSVAVLTSGDGEVVQGITVSTLALASVSPPMISVALRRGSRALDVLLDTPAFVANSLTAQQEPLARHFARPDRGYGLGQLPSAAWAGVSAQGVPMLAGAAAWLECRVDHVVPVGDHQLLLARVVGAARGTGSPLANFDGLLHAQLPMPSPQERNQ